MKNDDGWLEWFAELKRLGVLANWPIGSGDDWRNYFDDGYTPRQAINEDMSYALN